MPRLKDIERFKRELAALSREPEILAQWGESLEEPPPPSGAGEGQAGAPPSPPPPEPSVEPRGLAARAEARRKLREASRPPTGAEAPEEGLPPDFASLLADLPSEPEAEAPPPEPEAMDADLEALLGDFPEDGPLPPAETEAAEEEALPRETGEPGQEGEEGGSSIEDIDALLASFSESETGAAAAPAPEPPRTASPEEELAPEPGPEAPGGGEFELSELASFELPAEEEGPGEAPPAEEEFGAGPSAGAPLPETPSVEAPGPGEEAGGFELGEDFSLPDLDAFETEGGDGGPDGAEAAEPEAEAAAFAMPEFEPRVEGEAEAPEAPSPEARPPAEEIGELAGGFEIGEGAAGLTESFDAFDRFSFDEGPPSLAGEALDRELASLGEETPAASTFSLEEDWTGGFALPGEEAASRAAAAPRPSPGRREEGEEKAREVSLSESQVDRLQDRLLALPLNLRVAIEDVVANEKGSEALRSRLVWALVEGARLEDMAALAGRALKRRVAIPAGYEKRTGAALEAEKGTLRYAFVHTVLPLLRTALLALLAVSALAFLGWRFVYRPLAANALYRAGYARIAEDRYPEAEEAFGRAGKLREFRAWYYRYAEAYAAKRQYILAEKKYETLLSRYPGEIPGALAWAGIEREQLKYQEAARILQKLVLERDYLNKDALLLLGDVYLDWAAEDQRHYEDARRNYAALIQRYGSKDPYLERMLLYFIRTDKLSEVLSLKDGFLSQRKPSPRAETLAELGGYLFDKGRLEDVHRLLILADEKDPSVPETHYHLARYFGRSNSPGEERKALDKAVRAFARLPVLSSARLGMYIDALIRRGRFRLDAAEYVAAEEDFAAAATRYEEALELRRLSRSPRYGEAYAGLAEVAYRVRDDLDQALRLFERAAEHGYDNPEARYKRGYVHYRRARFAEAAEQFYMAGREGDESPYLLYAFGNSLYERGDFQAAEGYYRRVVDSMRTELERLELPSPQLRPSHEEIVELLMTAENNLGTALYRSAERLGKAELRASAMAAFAESARLFDSLTRDQKTLVRPDAKNLGFLNMDFILHPRRNIGLAIYSPIERSMRFPRR